MAAISWKNPVSSNWNVAANWSTGALPTLNDAVTIGVTGTHGYIVSITSADVASSLTFSAYNAELLENAGSLTTTGSLTVDGGLVVLNRANTFNGGVSLVRGALSVGNAGALGTGQINMTAGELLGTANETLTNSIAITNSNSVFIAAAYGTTLDIGSG